jgi:hypothetical protein
MYTWLTEIQAVDPIDGEMKSWSGPNIKANTIEEAKAYCDNNGLGYCKVIGKLIATAKADEEGNIDYNTLTYQNDVSNDEKNILKYSKLINSLMEEDGFVDSYQMMIDRINNMISGSDIAYFYALADKNIIEGQINNLFSKLK